MLLSKRILLLPAIIGLITSCTTTTLPAGNPHEIARPSAAPVRNMTGFTDALYCFDRLVAQYYPPGEPVILHSSGVIDKSGKNLGGDNREMLMATISRLSSRSNLFQFVNLPTSMGRAELENIFLPLMHRNLPNYEIVASISQLDENVSTDAWAGSFALPLFDISASRDRVLTVLSVDFNVTKPLTGEVINGLSVSNSIAIARRSSAGDMGAQIKKAGLFFNLSLDRSDGLFAALRALVELSTLELLGKLAEVPYWRCLEIPATDPEIQQQTLLWYTQMNDRQRIEFAQRRLWKVGLYRGAVDGQMTQATRNAISQYQSRVGLIASGRIDLDLYRQLTATDLRDRVRLAAASPSAQKPPAAAMITHAPMVVELTTPTGPNPTVRVSSELIAMVSVSQPAWLYCYYRDATGTIAQVYPNPFQDAKPLNPGETLRIPDSPRFALLLDTAGVTEKMLCLASEFDLGNRLSKTLLTPLQALPFDSLEAIESRFRTIRSVQLSAASLSVSVVK